MNDLKIEMWPIDDVIPYENNPRKNDDAVPFVANSLSEFGWRKPIVVDENGVIVVGHTRWKAAKRLGMTEVPVHVASGLTEEEIREYRIADNKASEKSTWNLVGLSDEIGSSEGTFTEFGFSEDEINNLVKFGQTVGKETLNFDFSEPVPGSMPQFTEEQARNELSSASSGQSYADDEEDYGDSGHHQNVIEFKKKTVMCPYCGEIIDEEDYVR